MGRARRVDVGGMIYHALNRANFRSRLFRRNGVRRNGVRVSGTLFFSATCHVC